MDDSEFDVAVHQDAIDDLMRSYTFVQKHTPNSVAWVPCSRDSMSMFGRDESPNLSFSLIYRHGHASVCHGTRPFSLFSNSTSVTSADLNQNLRRHGHFKSDNFLTEPDLLQFAQTVTVCWVALNYQGTLR